MRVCNKAEMYRRLGAGEFGNTMRTWPTVAAIRESGYRGDVSIRARDRANPVRLYHVEQDELADHLTARGLAEADVIFCEPPPDHRRTIQGELIELPGGLHFHYSFFPAPLRIALETESRGAHGVVATQLLRHYLDEQYVEHLLSLLDRFPGAAIEFSAFSVRCGSLGWPVVIWEVRNY